MRLLTSDSFHARSFFKRFDVKSCDLGSPFATLKEKLRESSNVSATTCRTVGTRSSSKVRSGLVPAGLLSELSNRWSSSSSGSSNLAKNKVFVSFVRFVLDAFGTLVRFRRFIFNLRLQKRLLLSASTSHTANPVPNNGFTCNNPYTKKKSRAPREKNFTKHELKPLRLLRCGRH